MNGLHELLDERSLSKLKWRCRRGLLENDLLLEKFFQRYETTLTFGQAQALNQLMDLADNDLLDLMLARRPPDPGTHADVIGVLALLQTSRESS